MSGICSRFKIIFASILISCIVLNLFPLSLLALDETYYSVSDEYKFSVTRVISSRWEDHANIDFTVTNNGNTTINNWYITTSIPYEVENIWNASIAETSDSYITISSAPQNQPIEPGCSVTFGITGYSEDDSLFDVESSFYLLNIEDVVIPVEKYQTTTNVYSTTETGFSGAIAITNISSELLTIENVVLNSTNGLTINGNAAIEDETTLVVDSNSRNIYPSASIYINFEGTGEIPEIVNLRHTGLAFTLTEDEDNDGILDIDEFLYPEEPEVTPTPTIAPTNTPEVEEPTETPMVTPEETPTVTVTPSTTPEVEEPTPTPEEITPTPVIGTEEVDVVLYVNDFEYRENLNLYFVNEYYDYFQGTLSGEELVDGFVIIIEDIDGEIIMQRDIEIASEWQILDLGLKLGYNKLILIVETAFDTVIRREYELLCTTPDYLQNLGIDTSIDIDNDGMSDYYETELGLSTETDDTDGDGLPDLFEMTESMTNPLLEDTDNNGVSDYNEDFDSDNLSYEEELLYGTSPIMFDSDFDEISDYDELNIYGTDPTLGDTDNDGLLDSEEILIGKNPCDESDAEINVLQTITTEINNAEDTTITSVDITMEDSGYLGYSTYAEDLYNIDVYSTEVVGRIGSPIGLNSNIDFDSATVVIHYDDALLGDTNEERLGVLWFDEANGVYIPQNQAIVDSEENTVTIELEHFSTYVLVDLDEWYGTFDNPDVGNRYMIAEDISGYYASNESLLPTIDEHESNCFAWWKLFHLRLGTFEIVERLRGICYPVSSIEYTFEYTWLVRNIKDSDNDGVCDCYERDGILGTNGHVYNMSSSMIDSDSDGLSDLEELGNIYSLYRGEDGRILILNNDGEVLFSGEYYIPETSEYYFLRNYVPGAGKTLTICVLKGNPNSSDTDGDLVLDVNDANPLDVARHSDMFSPCDSINDAIPNYANYINSMLPGLNDDFGIRDNSDPEYLSAQVLYYYALTAGTSMFDLLPEASYALTNYLTGGGIRYNFDMYNFILTSNYEEHIMNLFTDELYPSPSVLYTSLETHFNHHSVMGTYYYYLYLEYVIEYAKDVLKEGETICICSSNNGNRVIAFETSESTDIQNAIMAAIDFRWMLFLGSGGASGGIVAEITNNGGVYNISYRYAVFDTYDFTEDSTAMILPFASDGDMHELSEFGMAYEFFVYSESCEEYVYYTR